MQERTTYYSNIFTITEEKDFISSGMKVIAELTKVKITFLVTLTTALGYILSAKSIDFNIVYAVLGIFFLACAASVLNHYQERKYDAMMDRTKYRPIPSGRVSPIGVLIILIFFLIIGSLILFLKTNLIALLVGWFTLIWYNFVYTPLKRKTAFAIIPGALVGALPPAAGWAAANGSMTDPGLLMVVLYFFIWQIPHFWLLLILYGKDYKKAGYPTLNSIFTDRQIKRITFIWLIATVVIACLIPLSGVIYFTATIIVLLALSVWMIYNAFSFLKNGDDSYERKLAGNTFLKINFYTLIFIILLSADKIIKIITVVY